MGKPTPKDEFERKTDHWSQGKDKVKDLVNTDRKPKGGK